MHLYGERGGGILGAKTKSLRIPADEDCSIVRPRDGEGRRNVWPVSGDPNNPDRHHVGQVLESIHAPASVTLSQDPQHAAPGSSLGSADGTGEGNGGALGNQFVQTHIGGQVSLVLEGN